jgi:arylsulfatase A-like enzyme
MGVAENTVFWYTSDNGGLMKESSGGREKKGSIYEGGLRVPAIIEWPERIMAPRVVKALGNTADIYPTVMEIVGCEMEKQPVLDGVSLLPFIDGKSDVRGKPMGFWDFGAGGISTPSEEWMTEELAAQKAGKPYHDVARLMADAGKIKTIYPKNEVRGHSAWLDWPWKLHQIVGGKKKKATTTFELYNLEVDPMEAKDIIAEEPERAEGMKTELKVWLESVTDSLNGEDY